MSTIKSIIVDDEPLARKLMTGHVEKLPDWEIVGICKNAVEAYELLVKQPVDVLFLDINMPVVSGIDFYRSLKKPPHLVFTTAYPEYAVEGFELEAVDYLLKPITFNRFLKTAERISQKISSAEENTKSEEENTRDFIFIKHFSKLVKIPFENIFYIEAQKDFVKFVTKEEELLAGMSMKQTEDLLPADKFLRIHRSYIISIQAITAMFGNIIEIGNKQLPIGGNYKEKVVEKLSN